MIITPQSLAALRTGFKASFQGAFDGGQAAYERIATVVRSTKAAENYGWLGQVTGFREWIGDRVLQNLKAHAYAIKNKDFENTVEVDRNDIEDDDLGMYGPVFAQLGQDAKMFPDELVFGLLAAGFTTKCYDGQYFFDTDHEVAGASVSNFDTGANPPWILLDTRKVIKPLIYQERKKPEFVAKDRPEDEQAFMRKKFVYGCDLRCNVGLGLWQMAHASKLALTADNYAGGRSAMMDVKSDAGRPLNVLPNLLVVPPSLEKAALDIVKADRGPTGATNTFMGTAEVLVTPWLS